MGLDACVHCDCFEQGRLLVPPPSGITPVVEPDGSIEFDTRDSALWLVFENWRAHEACAHPRMRLIEHRLGNIGLIALLRGELERDNDQFPMLLQLVLYNGIHAGDFVGVEKLASLREEVSRIAGQAALKSDGARAIPKVWPDFGRARRRQSRDDQTSMFLRQFQMQMEELIQAATAVQKPICF